MRNSYSTLASYPYIINKSLFQNYSAKLNCRYYFFLFRTCLLILTKSKFPHNFIPCPVVDEQRQIYRNIDCIVVPSPVAKQQKRMLSRRTLIIGTEGWKWVASYLIYIEFGFALLPPPVPLCFVPVIVSFIISLIPYLLHFSIFTETICPLFGFFFYSQPVSQLLL